MNRDSLRVFVVSIISKKGLVSFDLDFEIYIWDITIMRHFLVVVCDDGFGCALEMTDKYSYTVISFFFFLG